MQRGNNIRLLKDRDLLFQDEIKGKVDRSNKLKAPKRLLDGVSNSTPVRVRRLLTNTLKRPEAVFKVSSWTHNASKAAAHAKYVTRAGKKGGDLHAEMDDGTTLTDPKEALDVVKGWGASKSKRSDARFTANVVLSSPKGSDPEAVKRAVREFAGDFFGGHEYMFVIHTDTDNPHAHVSVKAAGFDGKQLRMGKADLKRAREHYATHLLAQGIEVNASYRRDRGNWNSSKSQARVAMDNKGTSEPSIVKDVHELKTQATETKGAVGSKHDEPNKSLHDVHTDIVGEYLGAARYLEETEQFPGQQDNNAKALRSFAKEIAGRDVNIESTKPLDSGIESDFDR